MIVVNPTTRQFNIPGADIVFGVTADANSAIKHFQCPRYVGNNVDIASSFVRINYQNAHGEIDFYLVKDVTVDGDNVTFSWELHPKVTMYKGNVSFVMCVTGPDMKVTWHTTLGRGQVLEGLEPDTTLVETETADGIAALIAMVEAQTVAVEKTGTDQVAVVKTAAKTAQDSAVAEVEAKRKNSLDSIPDDYTSLGNAVDSLIRGCAGAIVCEAEGSAIAVKDASDMSIQGLRIFGRSTQDGIPTPDAPVEIVSVESPVVRVSGKNLLNPDGLNHALNGVTFINNLDGSFTVSGTGTQSVSFSLSDSRYSTLVLHKGVTYTQSVEVLSGTKDSRVKVVPSVRDSAGAVFYNFFTDNQTVTTNNEYTVREYSLYVPLGVAVNFTFRVQLEQGSVATPYEPYKPVQTIETTRTLRGIPLIKNSLITYKPNYVDSSGRGWVCDEVDVDRGVYVQRIKKYVADGTQNILLVSTSVEKTRFDIESIAGVPSGAVMCDSFVWDVSQALNTMQTHGTSGKLILFTNVATTVAEFKSYLATHPIEVLLLSEPVETPLSETEIAAYRSLHSNKPNTTILNDSGAHMKVEYAADTKLYIDNKLAALVGNT